MRPIFLFFAVCSLLLSQVFAGPLSFLLPQHELQVITVTDITKEGALLRPASPGDPVYYILSNGGFRDFGGIVAGEKLPTEKEVLEVTTKVLTDRGYLPATKGHPPSLLLCLTWGTLNVENAPGETGHASQINREQMIRFLGGYKVGLEYSAFPEYSQSAGLSFRSADAEAITTVATDDLFIIAIGAFDFHAMLKKEKKLLWTTKISAPSRGFWMKDVFTSMLAIGSPNIGRETAHPVWVNASDRFKGEVKMGETRVIEYIDNGKRATPATSKDSNVQPATDTATPKKAP